MADGRNGGERRGAAGPGQGWIAGRARKGGGEVRSPTGPQGARREPPAPEESQRTQWSQGSRRTGAPAR